MRLMTIPLAIRVSAAAHGALPYANPLSVTQVEDLISFIARTNPVSALDLGCGAGALAILRSPQKSRARVLGIDNSEPFLERAKLAAAGHVMSGEVRFMNASPASLPDGKFDAILCVGSSQAIGTPAEALAWCRDRLAPGGTLLFADLTWSRQPEPAFLEFLGVAESLYWRDEHEVSVFTDAGFRNRLVKRASPQAWREYEEAVYAGRCQFAEQLYPEEKSRVLARANACGKPLLILTGINCLSFSAYLLEGNL